MRIAWIFVLASQLAVAQGPLPLSMKRAVELATSREGNTRIQLSEEALQQARTRSAQTRAALVPNVDAAFNDQTRTANLASMGINLNVPIPGFHFPTFVGPFTTVDARLTGTQSVFDFSSIRKFRSEERRVGKECRSRW